MTTPIPGLRYQYLRDLLVMDPKPQSNTRAKVVEYAIRQHHASRDNTTGTGVDKL